MKRLEAHHWLAIKWLAMPRFGGKTKKEIAKMCGVSEQALYNWLKDPLFERELKREIVRNTLDRLPEVFEAVPDIIIRDGNAAMFKTLLQAHDMLTDRVEVEQKTQGTTADREELRRKIEEYRKRAAEAKKGKSGEDNEGDE